MNTILLKFLILSLLLTQSVFASKNLSAHVHGSVNLDIATDKKQLLVMVISPAESFLGFEYKAKTTEEKKIAQKAKNDWSNNIISYLGKDALKDCSIGSSKWEQHFEGKSHSRIEAEAVINCKELLSNRSLKIKLKSNYPRIKLIKLQLLRDNGSVENKQFSNDFEIKL